MTARKDRHGRRPLTPRPLVAALGSLLALGAGASAQAAGPPAVPANVTQLSDEQLTTRWANPAREGQILTRPADGSRRIGRLRLLTEDGFPEVYLVLGRWKDDAARTWLNIRVPGRPNGRTGWIAANALGRLRTVHTRLVVDRRKLRATLYDAGRVIFRARVGIGKGATPTPPGSFYIREKFRVIGAPIYGPRALGTSAYAPNLTDWPGGGVVGLHGTNQPGLIPGRPSHGCIRLRNADILRLYQLTPVGTPLQVV